MKTVHLVETTIAALALLLCVACSTTQFTPASDDPASTDDKSALVAFSVSSSEPRFLQSLDLVILGQQQTHQGVIKIPVHNKKKYEQVYLFNIPIDGARFGLVRFYIQGERWETVQLGPEILGTPGSLTYLGRIQTYSFQVNRTADTGRRYPTGVKFLISDASEDDLSQLKDRYAMLATMPVIKDIPKSWNDSDFSELRYHQISLQRDLSQYFGPVGPEIPAFRTQDQ